MVDVVGFNCLCLPSIPSPTHQCIDVHYIWLPSSCPKGFALIVGHLWGGVKQGVAFFVVFPPVHSPISMTSIPATDVFPSLEVLCRELFFFWCFQLVIGFTFWLGCVFWLMPLLSAPTPVTNWRLPAGGSSQTPAKHPSANCLLPASSSFYIFPNTYFMYT